ncbi:CBS domain-containing protein [Candidatus Micrarchaeota archaeon]|nr:CBS domain-containing protein [Candidatus Micrarchaeota archaeon]
MLPDISEVKVLRRKTGLTQAQLASAAGVSQSLIAKIEGGRLQPGYAVASKIFAALEQAGKKEEKTASEVLNEKVVFLSPSDSLKEAAAKMKRNAISQLPVFDGGKPVGLVTETLLLDALARGSAESVGQVMAEAPPVVAQSTPLGALAGLLKHCPIVLVAEKGRVKGVVTKSDLLEAMY